MHLWTLLEMAADGFGDRVAFGSRAGGLTYAGLLDTARRAAVSDDGWFPTRDAGFLDGDGYLYLSGRLDDVIVRGGENLSPGDIEDVLIAHPAVADAGVVGLPDVEWGEKVVAAVVLGDGASATEAELQAWVRSRLRSSRTPERVEFRHGLPYTETGKLLRRVLKELAAAVG